MASTPFFVAFVQAFKVLGYAGRNQIFPPAAARSLRTIKLCAIAITGFVAVAEGIILSHGNEDRAGGVFIGIVVAFASVGIAPAATVFERVLQSAVHIKAENDLTV